MQRSSLKWQGSGGGWRLSRGKEFHSKENADKGNFVAYSSDNKRFEIPLLYLSSNILIELLTWAEEKFGLPSDGPVTLPCDAVFMEDALSLIQSKVDKGVENPLFMSIPTGRCFSSSCVHQDQRDKQLLICTF